MLDVLRRPAAAVLLTLGLLALAAGISLAGGTGKQLGQRREPRG